jgi:hypothetical protein
MEARHEVPQPSLVQVREGRDVVNEVVAVHLVQAGHVPALPARADSVEVGARNSRMGAGVV